MNSAGRKLLATVQEAELAVGVNFVNDGALIVYKDSHGRTRATRNRCRHQSGRFKPEAGCVLTCPNHGWRLDVSRMEYVNPEGGVTQEELQVEKTPDGAIYLFERRPASPWDVNEMLRQPLRVGELTLRFYAHACMEIGLGGKRLFTDPWLVGPAFTRGWWLAHKPPADWLDSLAAADAIYISHNHSDHLNRHTLKRLVARNPNVPVFVPQYAKDSCQSILRSIGLKSVSVVPFGVWVKFGDLGRFMILADQASRDDSGILIEYKGHRILNTVDCSNLCGGNLPGSVDVLLTSFASGASGYPVCWSELYSEEFISRFVLANRRLKAEQAVQYSRQTQAKVYIPFAGYFEEAHPKDSEIRRLNVHNTPEEVCAQIRQQCPGIVTWIPEPGQVLNLARLPEVPAPVQPELPEHDFEEFLSELRQAHEFGPLQSMEGVRRYFEWAGFYAKDLILHVIETDEDFTQVVREFYVDFSDLSFPPLRPTRPHRYLRMKVRSDVFRHVLRWALPWEEISIGFQARFYREPDKYNLDFWDHFQNQLPSEPLPW